MGQFKWTYVDDIGQRFNIGLVHGNKTGHLMVYCNQKIIVVDFHVFKTKTYSFFIEDELCNLTIEIKDNRCYYGLEIDKDTLTPKNELRRKLMRKNVLYIFLIITLTIMVILTLSVLFTRLTS